MPHRPEFGSFVTKLTTGLSLRKLGRDAGLDVASVVRARAGHVGRPETVAALADALKLEGADRESYFNLAGVKDPGAPAAFPVTTSGPVSRWHVAWALAFMQDMLTPHARFGEPTEAYSQASEELIFDLAGRIVESGVTFPNPTELLRPPMPLQETKADAQRDVAFLEALVLRLLEQRPDLPKW